MIEVHEGGNSTTIISDELPFISVGSDAVDYHVALKYYGPPDNPRPRRPRLKITIEELDD